MADRVYSQQVKKVKQTLDAEFFKNDEETIIRVPLGTKSMKQIKREKENARISLILGLPVIFSFEVVKNEHKIGIKYEDPGTNTLGQQIMRDMENLDKYITLYAETLKKVHRTNVASHTLPPVKDVYIKNITDMGDLLTQEEQRLCFMLINAVPEAKTYVSRGLSPQNLMYTDDGSILMSKFDLSGYGHPFFDFSDLSIALTDFPVNGPTNEYAALATGVDNRTALKLWRGLMKKYFCFNTKKESDDMEILIRQFGNIVKIIMPVVAPGISNKYKKAAFEEGKKCLFPIAKELMGKIEKIEFKIAPQGT